MLIGNTHIANYIDIYLNIDVHTYMHAYLHAYIHSYIHTHTYSLVLSKFCFTENAKHYLQIGGTAMGTRAAPSHANTFMG